MPETFAMVLDGREVDVQLDQAITSTTYDLSIESTLAVTLVVQDQRRQLRRSGILDRDENGKLDASIEIQLDGIPYRLADVKKAGDVFTLGFVDRAVARLQSSRGQLKPKGSGEHVEFARMLCKRVGVELVTPTGVAVTKSGSTLNEKRQRSDADDRRERGMPASAPLTGGGPFGSGTLSPATASSPRADDAAVKAGDITSDELTVKGVKAKPDQIRNAEVLLGVATEEEAGDRATEAIMVAAIGESSIRDVPNAAGSPYGGVLQALKTRGLSTSEQAHYFMVGGQGYQAGGAIAAAKDNADWSAGTIAYKVEGSRANFPSNDAAEHHYQQHIGEAKAFIAAYGGMDVIGAATAGSRASSLVQRGTPEDPNEDSWTALVRIGEAKGWRAFALRGRIYYAREQDLIKSRARAILSEQDPAVDWIDWEVSPRKRVNTATVQCRASLWAIPPGAAVIVRGEGVADGRWLVASFRRTRDSQRATVDLRRGTELLKPQPTEEGGTDAGVGGKLEGKPKEIIDEEVLPLARELGVARSVAQNDAANAVHGPTSAGRRSDHQGPPSRAWAADLPCRSAVGDKLARALATHFGFPGNGSGSFERHVKDGYSVQILWRVEGHFDHVHCGIQKV